MTYPGKGAAMDDGEPWLKTMPGKGWKLRVWENLGWHWCLDLPLSCEHKLCVHKSLGDGFFALLGARGGGNVYWTKTSPTMPTPAAAAIAQLVEAERFVTEQKQLLDEVRTSMGLEQETACDGLIFGKRKTALVGQGRAPASRARVGKNRVRRPAV